MRLPSRTPGAPGILEVVDAHYLAGSQRAKDEKTGELGDYVDGIDNHFLFANGYSGLAEIVGGSGQAVKLASARISRNDADGQPRRGRKWSQI